MFKRLLLTLGVMGCGASPDTRPPWVGGNAESARQFVQAFYDWYVPLGDRLPASQLDSVVIGRANHFVPVLRAALQQDLAAQRSTSDIVSVVGDYDPFVMSQDPCPRYEARATTDRATGVEVAVVGRCIGDSATVAVLVDVVRDGTSWRFADFRRPDAPTASLIDVLRAAQSERDTSASAERITLRLLRDVPVVRDAPAQDRRGVLYGDSTAVLPRGTVLTSTGDVGEGGCRVYAGALRLALASCPWLPGFTDHQADIFAVQSRRGPSMSGQ